MKTTSKYSIPLAYQNASLTVENAKSIRVGMDSKWAPCLWVEGEITSNPKKWEIEIIDEGETAPKGIHLGSFNYGHFVWHVYKVNY